MPETAVKHFLKKGKITGMWKRHLGFDSLSVTFCAYIRRIVFKLEKKRGIKTRKERSRQKANQTHQRTSRAKTFSKRNARQEKNGKDIL